jgi:hypothetical protein
MRPQRCRVCSGEAYAYTEVVVRGRHHSHLYNCSSCGFVFIEPVYWLDEAYAEAVAQSDIGYVSRNLAAAEFLSIILGNISTAADFFVDYGGGYGLLVRLMRDKGFRFHLYEPHAQNLFAQNCDADRERFGPYRALTAIEVFEHLANPMLSVAEMSLWSQCIVFTTELCPVPKPAPEEWWYLGLDHGQHISFYTRPALNILASQHNLQYFPLGGSWHILTAPNDLILAKPKLNERALDPSQSVVARLAARASNRLWRRKRRGCLIEHDFNAVKRIIGMSAGLVGNASGHIDDP